MKTDGDKQNFSIPLKLWIFGFVIWIIFSILRACRRIRVKGLKNLRATPWQNRILLPNHPSMLDPALIPFIGFAPGMLFDLEKKFPWQTPNGEFEDNSNFSYLKKLPLIFLKTDDHGRPNDAMVTRTIMRQLKKSTFIIFPEGTRSYNSDEPKIKTPSGISIGSPRDGVAFLISSCHPTVIPVLVKGADKVLPSSIETHWQIILQSLVRIWLHKIEIVFGEPIYYADITNQLPVDRENKKVLYQKLGERVVKKIAELDTQKNRNRRNKNADNA